MVEKEEPNIVNKSKDNLSVQIKRKVHLFVMEQSSSPVGENKPDGDGGHNLVSQCKTEIQHLLLPYNSLLIFTVKLL